MWKNCREREKFRLCLGQSLLLGFTGIVKGTGLFFAGAAGVYACWRLVQKEREKGARKSAASGSVAPISAAMAAVLVLAASLAAPFLLWQDHVRTDLAGFEGKFQIIGDAKEEAGEDLYGQIAGDFIRAAIHPADRAFQAFVFCSVLTAGASLYARIRLKRKWKLLRVYFLGVLVLAAYYGGMLYLYLFTMPEEEAVRLAGDAWPARGKTDPERYLILASDAEGQVSSGEMRYVFRYFLWAEDVEVGDIREREAWEAEIREGKYDRIFWMPGEP